MFGMATAHLAVLVPDGGVGTVRRSFPANNDTAVT
jgi:hypothetical protein